MLIEGIKYREVNPGDEADFDQIVQVEREGWEDYLAFPENWMREDFEMFPELQILAINEDTGRLVGKMSAVRLAIRDGENVDEFIKMEGENWEEIYAGRRDPKGVICEGSGLVVIPEFRGRRIAQRLGVMRARAIAAQEGIERVAIQSRKVGYLGWAEKRGKEGPAAHREYIDLVLAGKIHDQVLSVHLKIFSALGIEGKIINDFTPWGGDMVSGDRGVRFDITELLVA